MHSHKPKKKMNYNINDKVKLVSAKTIGNVTIPTTSVGTIKTKDTFLESYTADFSEKNGVLVTDDDLTSAN